MPSARRRRPLLLGHRGASQYAPENTLAAFDLALAHGCDGFEFDVRYTSDRRAIICHDPEMHGFIIEKTNYGAFIEYRENVREGAERAAILSDRRHKNYIPCLEDVLQEYRTVPYLDIELKIGGMEEDVVRLLKAHPPMGAYIVSSFLPEVLMKFHELDPELHLGIIGKTPESLSAAEHLPIRAIFAHYRLVTRQLIEKFEEWNKQVIVWTVNQQPEMLRLANLGVDGIISDDTKLLCDTLGIQSQA